MNYHERWRHFLYMTIKNKNTHVQNIGLCRPGYRCDAAAIYIQSDVWSLRYYSFANGLVTTIFGIAGKEEHVDLVDGYMDGKLFCCSWMKFGVEQVLWSDYLDGSCCSSARNIPY